MDNQKKRKKKMEMQPDPNPDLGVRPLDASHLTQIPILFFLTHHLHSEIAGVTGRLLQLLGLLLKKKRQ